MKTVSNFVELSTVYNLDESIIVEAIKVRRKYGIKLPDAIIAATAIVHKLTLITNDFSDFENIKGLKTLRSYHVK